MTSQDTIAKVPDTGDRWWLPGPPPRRRQISIEAVELSRCADELAGQPPVPIRQVDLWSTRNRTTPTLQAYFENQCTSSSTSNLAPFLTQGPESVPETGSGSGSGSGSPTHPTLGKELYLFHCCANEVTPILMQSFARRGPSIRFARRNGYFSRTPAVYWTNSLDFAFAWGVFTATGKWTIPRPDERFECIVYVSKVNLAHIKTPHGMYSVAVPECAEKEQRLVDWCHANMTSHTHPDVNRVRVPPPFSTKANWSIIGSRIPRHTIDGMKNQEVALQELPALGRMDLESTWMYAACDEASSVALAKRAVEIMHIVSGSAASNIDLAKL